MCRSKCPDTTPSSILRNCPLNMDQLNLLDDGKRAHEDHRYVFEVSWEVLNKVGGIFTVIKSKADITIKELGNHYVLIGPYNEYSCQHELKRGPLPHKEVNRTLDLLREKGLKVHTGRWLTNGTPFVILFEIASVANNLREWRNDFLERTHIRIPWEDCEVNDALIFGYTVFWFFGQLHAQWSSKNLPVRIIGHFHEWISAIGLILCRQQGLQIATIFTTHATLIGRHLSAGRENINCCLETFDCDKEAADRGFYYRYCIEKVTASITHVLTTVSKITAEESSHFLGRYPDHITPNGMNGEHSVATEDLECKHRTAKEKIDSFIRGHFYGYLNFDLEKVVYMFIAGRYEYYNKGCDLFIEALARLNHLLRSDASEVTVIAFIIMPAETHGYNDTSLRLHNASKQLQKTAQQLQDVLSPDVVRECLSGLIPTFQGWEDIDELEYLTSSIANNKPDCLPPICTHNMNDDNKDLVLKEIRRCQLFNDPTDRVKVIFHPEFLSASGMLLPMEYEEFVHGCHLGVFPSYYEPWGYTPAECAVIGVSSVTTNMSGYGCYIADLILNPQEYGIYIVDRKFRGVEASVQQLTQYLHDFTKQSKSKQRLQRQQTQLLRDLLDWKLLGTEYHKARELAIERTRPNSAPSIKTRWTISSISFLNKLKSLKFSKSVEKVGKKITKTSESESKLN